MKKDEMAREYETYETLKKAYDTAKDSENEAGMNAARIAYKKLSQSIESKGEDYCMIYRLYEDARERGNEYIDLNDPDQYKDVKKLLTLLREYGFERVTFSSSWSSAVETAWELAKLGCAIEGMTEINGTSRSRFNGSEYERIPAFIFRLN